MVEAFQEELITIDELRARMPDLRAREAGLRGQLQALDAQVADREIYLRLADDLEGFLTQLAATPTPPASPTASTCSGCWSTTSSSDPRRSPSGTASPSANGPALGSPQVTARPTRRVTTGGVIHCVGGVLALPLGFEAVDDSPLPRNGLGNGAAGDDMVSDAHAVRVLNRGYRRARGRAWAVCERQGGSGDVPDSELARRYRRVPFQITPSPVATTRPASASPSRSRQQR